MHLYKLELCKIVNRKFTWLASGAVLLLMLALCGRQIAVRDSVVAEFGQAVGYRQFLELSQMFLVFASIWLMAVLSPFYCEDKQNRTDVLISVTAKGRESDFYSRTGVTFTLSAISFLFAVFLAFFACLFLYGYSGGNLPAKEIYVYLSMDSQALAEKSIFSFAGFYFFVVFSAFAMLDALIIWVSANSKKTTHSLIAIFVVAFLPAMLEGVFKNGKMNVGYILVTGQPFMMTALRCLGESWEVYGWHILMAYCVSCIGIWGGKKKWCFVPVE